MSAAVGKHAPHLVRFFVDGDRAETNRKGMQQRRDRGRPRRHDVPFTLHPLGDAGTGGQDLGVQSLRRQIQNGERRRLRRADVFAHRFRLLQHDRFQRLARRVGRRRVTRLRILAEAHVILHRELGVDRKIDRLARTGREADG